MVTKNMKRKAVELNLAYNRVSSVNFIQILSLNFSRFLTDHCRKCLSMELLTLKLSLELEGLTLRVNCSGLMRTNTQTTHGHFSSFQLNCEHIWNRGKAKQGKARKIVLNVVNYFGGESNWNSQLQGANQSVHKE